MQFNADQDALRDAAHAFAQERGLAELSAYSLYVPEELGSAERGDLTLAQLLP